jgi:curli biogenesis system outer membrane secretion channel CsgG
LHAEVIPLRCNFVQVKNNIQHKLYSGVTLLFLALVLVGCSTYKSQLHDAKEYEEARMYSKALSLYSELLVRKETKEALLGKKRVVEAMIMENYDGPIRMLCMQEKLNDAERLYSELSVFVEKNRQLDVKEPFGLKEFILQSKQAYCESLYKQAESDVLSFKYDNAKEKLRLIRSFFNDFPHLLYLESLCELFPNYYLATKSIEEGRLRDAYKALKKIEALDPSFKDSKQLLDSCLKLGRITVAYVSIDRSNVNDEVEKEMGALMLQSLLENKDPFLVLLDRDYTSKLLEEQKLGMSGLYDEKTLIQAGKLVGAKYILMGEIIEYSADQKKNDFGVKKGFLGKTINDTKVKYHLWNKKFSIQMKYRISMVDSETGETLFNSIYPQSKINEINWAEYNGDYKMVYPGSWDWEIIKTGADFVDISKYAELQKLFSQKPTGSELNQLGTGFLKEMATVVKRGVETKIIEITP